MCGTCCRLAGPDVIGTRRFSQATAADQPRTPDTHLTPIDHRVMNEGIYETWPRPIPSSRACSDGSFPGPEMRCPIDGADDASATCLDGMPLA